MRAILFTLFAPGYVQDTIVPRLRARGVHVTRTLEPKQATNTRIDEDIILFMHEFGPHACDQWVRSAAKAAGKRMVCLTRKAGNWPLDLRDDKALPTTLTELEPSMLPLDRRDGMLRALVAMRDAGQTYEAIAPQLVKFWRAGEVPPADGHALRRLVETIRELDEPKWFALWRPALGATGAVPRDDSDGDAELLGLYEAEVERLEGWVRELEARAGLAPAAVEAARVLDVDHLPSDSEGLRKELAAALDEAKLWHGEFDKLRDKHAAELDEFRAARDREVNELRGKLTTAIKRVKELEDALESERAEWGARVDALTERCRDDARYDAPAINGFGEVLGAMRPLVKAGLLTADEALDKLLAYQAKMGG